MTQYRVLDADAHLGRPAIPWQYHMCDVYAD
jgi:hypothetical protein